MEPIIAIAYNNNNTIMDEKTYNSCSNSDLLKYAENSLFKQRPPSFKDFKKLISEWQMPKEKVIQKIIGFYPSGERIEVVDDYTYKTDISIYMVIALSLSKQILPDLDASGSFETDYKNLLQSQKNIGIKFKPGLKKIEDDIKENMCDLRKMNTDEINQIPNKLYSDFNDDDKNMFEMKKSKTDIPYQVGKKKDYINEVKNSFQSSKRDLIDKKSTLTQSTRFFGKEIKGMKEIKELPNYRSDEEIVEEVEEIEEDKPKKKTKIENQNDNYDFEGKVEELNENNIENNFNEENKKKECLEMFKELKNSNYLSELEKIDIINKNIESEKSEIKEIVEKEIEKRQQMKIDTLMEKLKQEFDYIQEMDMKEIEENIINFDFNEDKIKEWIQDNKPNEQDDNDGSDNGIEY